jgi:hypothetical protein
MLVYGVGATIDDIHRQRALKVWPVAEFLGSNVTTRHFSEWIGRVFAYRVRGIFAAGAKQLNRAASKWV